MASREQVRAERERRREPITDPAFLNDLASRLIREVLRPMLGIAIEAEPTVVADRDLPEGVLGFYRGPENLIRLQPQPLRGTVGVLAHELAHAWSLQGGFSPLLEDESWDASRIVFLEGFAQWVEFKAMDYYGFEVEMREIHDRGPDAYGIGFRMFDAFESDPVRGGVRNVIRFVRAPDTQWLRDYVRSGTFRTDVARATTRRPADWDDTSPPPPPPAF